MKKRIEDVEKRFNRIIQLDPKVIDDSLKAEEENVKLIVKVEKCVNVIDNNVKNLNFKKKEIAGLQCAKCESVFKNEI